MPRGRKNYTLEEQLERVTNDISTYESSLQTLKIQKEELERQVKEQRVSELVNLIDQSGKSIDDIKEMLGLQ